MYKLSKTASKEILHDAIKKAINKITMIVVFNHQGIIQSVNPRFEEISHYKKEEMVGQSVLNFFTNDFSSFLAQKIPVDDYWSKETKQQRKNGAHYWVESTLIPITNSTGEHPHYILLQQEITKRKNREQKLENLAYIDPLTGLANRHHLEQFINQDKHLQEKEITVLFIDIDAFTNINDNFGHDVGDHVLITLSRRLKEQFENNSLIFRYDGEEFIILFENESKQAIHEHLKQVLAMIREPIRINDYELLVTASIGISNGNPSTIGKDVSPVVQSLIRQADTAMHLAKKNGGNSFHFHSTNDSRQLERTYQIELEIREALERQEFSIVYQPLINLKTNKMVGVESLLRWNNRLLGSVSPAEFIPVLEETGLIVPIGKWILKTVSEQMKNWQEQRLFLQRISVNVSPVQFRDSNFVKDVKTILHNTQLDASYLEVEITEGTLLDIKNSRKKLHDLQELGVKVSIDDFGTGYSSLSYLKELPIDTLKIDKSFIDDLDRDGKIIVNTIISMGKNLQFRVIAEGIENSLQFKYLQEQKCHEGQGYFFSRPVESKRIEELYYSLQ